MVKVGGFMMKVKHSWVRVHGEGEAVMSVGFMVKVKHSWVEGL